MHHNGKGRKDFIVANTASGQEGITGTIPSGCSARSKQRPSLSTAPESISLRVAAAA
jgi:hypothetical protein